jgi:uncharacterized protein YecE (DUF72 family)
MGGEILIGTSGWHYPGGAGTWNGPFYPKPRPRGFDELRYYAERFNTVEVNATFYRQPDPGMSAKWLERTPASFHFSLKLFQKFTHPDMYLKRPGTTDWNVNAGDLDEFRIGVEPIAAAGRLGAILMQFPSSFHATPEARDYVSWLLRAFKDYPTAVEFRHKSWAESPEDLAARLNETQAALVLIDEPFSEFKSARVQEFKSPIAYVRLHGRNKANWWDHEKSEDRYNYLYSEVELQPVADFAKEEAELEKRVLIYLNNHFSAKAVANADILKQQVGEPEPTWGLRP